MFVRGVKVTVINIAIEVLVGLTNQDFKLNVYSVHYEIIGGIRDTIKYAIWNMRIRSSLGEVYLTSFIFGWCDNDIHMIDLLRLLLQFIFT